MRSARFLALGLALVLTAGCDDEAFPSDMPDGPPPPAAGLQAYLQVDNANAQPGQRVNVFVRVQFGRDDQAKLGSYTGRLLFDPETLGWLRDVSIDDGLRVVNPEGAPEGLVRFAGASARGFEDLTVYQGLFEVRDAAYLDGMRFELEEVTAALTLADYTARLETPPQIFLRQEGR